MCGVHRYITLEDERTVVLSEQHALTAVTSRVCLAEGSSRIHKSDEMGGMQEMGLVCWDNSPSRLFRLWCARYLENSGQIAHVEEVVELGGCREHLRLHRPPQANGYLGQVSYDLRSQAVGWLTISTENAGQDTKT